MYRSLGIVVVIGLLASACGPHAPASDPALTTATTPSTGDGVRTLGNLNTTSGPGDEGSLATAGGSNQAGRAF